jgi:16S rRNA (guanine527-N7)-methyltransferase
MFHVKHPRKPPAQKPDQIAKRTIEQVEETLKEIRFIPDNRDFWFRIERFAAALALWGAKANLTAAPDDPTELAFHIVDSLAPLVVAARPEGAILGKAFGDERRVLDLGSGAGFPGLILAAASEARFTLLEARRKRASFLTIAAAEMGLSNVEIEGRRRAPEQLSPAFDAVTGRAFANPVTFYRAAVAALRPGGLAILYANPEQELDEGAATAAELGEFQRIAYTLPRGNRAAERTLALWRKRHG